MKDVFNYLLEYFKKHKWRYVSIVFFMLIASFMYVVPIYLIRIFIDRILQDDFTKDILLTYVLLFFASIILAYISEFIWNYYIFIGSYDMRRNLRGELMAHFLKMRPPFYEHFKIGDLITRSSDDVQVMGMTTGYGIMVFLNTSVYLSFILAMMIFTVSWKLTLVALIPMPLLAYFIFKWGSLVDSKFTEAQKAVSEMNSDVLEVIDGIRVVRAFGQEEAVKNKFQEKTAETLEKNNDVSEIDSRFNPLITICLALSFVGSFSLGAFLIEAKEITIGAMVSFQVYLGMIVWPMISAGDLVNVMQQGRASLRRIKEVLNKDDDIKATGTLPLKTIKEITFKDFSFHYPNEKRNVLNQLNLTLKAGKSLGIVGKTGSGKTTFLQQFTHIYPYSSLPPFINGQALTLYKREDLKEKFTEVPQEHTLFSRSIKENLLFGKENASDQQLLKALELACFKDEVLKMKDGLNTLVGEKGISLSGGQKQRLSLARAFLREGEFLLLDDALSAVDAKTEQKIIANLKKINRTLVIVTHRLSAVSDCDTIIVLTEGKISQRGTHEELIHTPGWYQEQYYHQQIKGGVTHV